jgi:hypothetical protein
MKTIKKIDFWLQVLLIVGFSIGIIIEQRGMYFTALLVIGIWQISSMIGHSLKSCFTANKTKRWFYNRITLLTLVVMAMGLVTPPFAYVYFVLLYIAPAMALYYTFICGRELYLMQRRPLAMLK